MLDFPSVRILLAIAAAVSAASAEKLPVEDIPADSAVTSIPAENEEPISGLKMVSGGFVHGFVATFCVIVVSELGDKTFFIAAIMAMRHSRLTVVSGAISALAVMHVVSALFGSLALSIVPKKYTFYISSGLFAIFGLKMLREAWLMSNDDGQEEMEEVREELIKKEAEDSQEGGDVENQKISKISRLKRLATLIFSPVFLQALTMTFLAEWGDRSQLATIVLATREDIWAVVFAGILGHSLCTGLAVLGGRFIAQKISVRTVTFVGGFVFIIFAVTAFFIDPDS